MKIAFLDVTVTNSYGGVQTAVWQLAIALSDLGHEVTVFGGEGEVRPELGGRPITVKTYPFTHRDRVLDLGSRFRRLWERWSFARHAKADVLAGDFDWVILTKPFDFFWPWLLRHEVKRPRFCFMSGGTDFFRFDRRLGRRVDAWVACSHFNAWQIAHHYKRTPRVIFNGVATEVFAPDAARRTQLRSTLGFTADDVVFAYAGRMVGWKGLGVAIEALAQPALRDASVRLLLIGDGAEKKDWESAAQRLGVADRVHFVPPVSHHALPGYYAAADAGIFPSIGDEAFGITIAEAMSCGLPVIASHVGGIPEVVGNEGACGVLVGINQPAAVAEAMLQLSSDPARRAEMGAAARERVLRLFTWRQSAMRLLAALD